MTFEQTPQYTSGSYLVKRLKILSGSLLTTDDMNRIIIQAECIVDGAMQMTGRTLSGQNATPDFTFNEHKHGIIRDATEAVAAYMCAQYDPTLFSSSSQAAFTADILWSDADRALGMLANKPIQRYLKTV